VGEECEPAIVVWVEAGDSKSVWAEAVGIDQRTWIRLQSNNCQHYQREDRTSEHTEIFVLWISSLAAAILFQIRPHIPEVCISLDKRLAIDDI
jgi:hypothetical protein